MEGLVVMVLLFFDNETDQLRALNEKNNFLVTGPVGEPRNINLSISSSAVSSDETPSAPPPPQTQ